MQRNTGISRHSDGWWFYQDVMQVSGSARTNEDTIFFTSATFMGHGRQWEPREAACFFPQPPTSCETPRQGGSDYITWWALNSHQLWVPLTQPKSLQVVHVQNNLLAWLGSHPPTHNLLFTFGKQNRFRQTKGSGFQCEGLGSQSTRICW